MIRPSACQPQADQFPALSGRHGDRQSYTISWDTIADLVPSVIYKGKAHPYRENQIPTLLGAEATELRHGVNHDNRLRVGALLF
jgi:hypothetical protein